MSINVGTCRTDPSSRELFMSKYMEPFDAQSYYDENPECNLGCSPECDGYCEALRLNTARNEHNAIAVEKINEAKQICSACPILDICRAQEEETSDFLPLFGVVAGRTERERWEARGSRRDNIRRRVSSRSAITIL